MPRAFSEGSARERADGWQEGSHTNTPHLTSCSPCLRDRSLPHQPAVRWVRNMPAALLSGWAGPDLPRLWTATARCPP